MGTLSPSAMKVLVLIICLGVVSANILKREAKSDPKAFGVGFGHGIGAIGYVRTSHHVPVTTTHHVATTHHVPVVKSCERNPKTKQRNVFRTVCDTVVDVEEIQDCTETVTSNCETVRHSTKKVGYETINKSGGSSAPLQVGGGSVDYSDYSNYGGGVEEA